MKPFLPLLSIVLLSSFAAWIDMINILTLVGYELKQGPVVVGLVAISMVFPHLVFARLFSNVAKKASFRSIMCVSLIGRALCTFSLFFLPAIEYIILILLVRSTLFGFMQPALASYVSGIPKTVNIAAVLSLIVSSSKIVAPAIGGIFAVVSGEQTAFLTSAVLTLVALGFIPWLRGEEPDPAKNAKASSEETTTTLPKLTLVASALFVAPVLFVDGLSQFFSNVIPYTFHEFSVSKMTLSLALSVSAIGNISAGLLLIKKLGLRTFHWANRPGLVCK